MGRRRIGGFPRNNRFSFKYLPHALNIPQPRADIVGVPQKERGTSMSSFPFNPLTSPDTSAEQNIQLQPSSYQNDSTQPTSTAPISSTTSSSHTSTSASGSISGSQSSSSDSVSLSLNAQAKQLSQQGMSPSDIAQTLGATVASIDSYLNITPTATATSSSTSPTAASNITL